MPGANALSVLRAVIRTDASPTVGGGHAMRCTSLALALAAQDWTGLFVCSRSTPETCPQIGRIGWPVVILPDEALYDPTALADAAERSADLLVTDSYAIDARYEAACRDWAGAILAIDDLANRPHDADYLLDQNLGRRQGDYRDKLPSHCRVFTGSSYALLRPSFPAARNVALARRQENTKVERILVNFGLGDSNNATSLTLEALQALRPACRIDVVLGQAAPWRRDVERQVSDLPAAHLMIDVADMADLMANADLAIGAPGSSALERACLGLPSLLLIIADNQIETAEELVNQGAARLCGRQGSASAADIRATLKDVIDDSPARRQMASAAAALCDGRGAERLADALTQDRLKATKNVATTR